MKDDGLGSLPEKLEKQGMHVQGFWTAEPLVCHDRTKKSRAAMVVEPHAVKRPSQCILETRPRKNTRLL